jgi:H+/Cl- antiporter ClcA
MQRVKLLLTTALVGAITALVYYLFERLVDIGIDKIWIGIFNTNNSRLSALLLTISFGLVYFSFQHVLDPKSENKKEEALGIVPKITVKNLGIILFLGFLSLFAGASLGPEAILIPASLLVGGIVGKKIYKSDKKNAKLFGAAGLVALFTAFFNSIAIGILSIYILLKKVKIKFSFSLLMIAIVASVSCMGVLKILESDAYLKLPHHDWHISWQMFFVFILLFVCGYFLVYAMSNLDKLILSLKSIIASKSWLIKAIVAAVVLGILYYIGGPLVEFTGNKSIKPMFEQSKDLGLASLLFIAFVKILSIAWCKAMGYRGGLIFATAFVAATFIAIINLYTNTNLLVGLIVVFVGILFADRKYKYILG